MTDTRHVVEFQVNQDDVVAWTRHSLRRDLGPGAAVMVASGIVLMLAGVALRAHMPWVLGLGAALLALNIAVVMLWYTLRPRLSARNAAKRPGYLGTWRVEIADDSLVWSSPSQEAHYPWDSISRVDQDDSSLYVYRARSGFIPIPSRAFADPQTASEFRLSVERHLTGGS